MARGLYARVREKEKALTNNIEKNAIFILDNALIQMNKNKGSNLIIFSAVHLQIAVELFIKSYVCKVYGFRNILDKEFKRMRESNIYEYSIRLEKNNIKTLGFSDLKSLLEQKNDYFGFVIKEGKSYLYNSDIQYDYLTGVFKKFQHIRNNFVHLGIDINIEDIKWVQMEMYIIIIYFVSTIININKRKDIQDIFDQTDVYITSIDVLMSKLSTDARLVLENDEDFEAELSSIAEDISGPMEYFKCTKCGKETLALNIKETERISKCLYCGDYFQVDYCECSICNDDAVVYDGLNIDANDNVILGYCYRCQKKIKVYRCPKCGEAYTYNSDNPIHFKNECCAENFRDRDVLGVDY